MLACKGGHGAQTRRLLLRSLSAQSVAAIKTDLIPGGTAVASKQQLAESTKKRSHGPPRGDDLDNDYLEKKGLLLPRTGGGYTFGGGPGAIREEVKVRAAREVLEGGLLEMSHREVGPIHQLLRTTQDLIRSLLNVPENYEILFIQGGAHAQFSAVPLNFGAAPRSVALVTGSWSAKAAAEQKRFGSVVEYSPSNADFDGFDFLKKFDQSLAENKADYGYLCSNETMRGVQLSRDNLLPSSSDVPLVVDATSDLFSRPIDISRFGVVFASGGKNLGPAGFAVVIARRSIIDMPGSPACPSFLAWKEYANSKPVQNIYNTPPMLSIGLARMVLEDLAERGGVEWAGRRTAALANEVYREIDASKGFYVNSVPKHLRSNVSVVFGIPHSKALEAEFVKQAEKAGLLQLVNHPSVGGMRASLYNAVPARAVEALVSFMRSFRDARA